MFSRRQDSSIGFGAPVRANMATSGVTSGAITSSLLESVTTLFSYVNTSHSRKEILVLKCRRLHFQVESADLTAYGLIPEFVGRFPILVSLSALTEDQLIRVF